MPEVKYDQGEKLFEVLTTAAELSGMGVVVTIIDGEAPRVVYLSDGLGELVGLDADEIEKRSVWSFIAEDDLPPLLRAWQDRVEGAETPMFHEFAVIRSDGERIPLEVFNSIVSIGSHTGVVSFVRDISLRKSAEERLRQSEERFRSLVENAPDGIAILQGEKVVFLNPYAASLAGVGDPEQAVGMPAKELFHPDDHELYQKRIVFLKRTGTPIGPPALYRARDTGGRDRVAEVSAISIKYRGEPAVLAFVRDATERIETQDKLAQVDRLSALGSMAAGLAHEINNPLTYLTINIARARKSLSDSMKRAGGTEAAVVRPPAIEAEKLLALLEDAQQGAERVAGIVRDIQRCSRPPSEEKRAIALSEALDDVLAMAGHAAGHRVRIVRKYRDALSVFGSPSRVERLFLNLVINAVQAFDQAEGTDGRVEVSVSRSTEGAVVEIADNGCGMGPETIERIFDPFFTTKGVGEGTGLGLAICKTITDELGGRIEVESEPGRGTRFRVILLPAHEQEPAGRDEAETARRRRVSSGSVEAARGGTRSGQTVSGRLLLIDDEPEVARALQAFLSDDFEVEVTFCGSEGLRLIEAGGEFDAVLCDLAMPNMNGAEFRRKLAEIDPELAARTVIMTGMLGSALRELLGPDVDCPLLQKPFEPEQFRKVLAKVVNGEAPEPG